MRSLKEGLARENRGGAEFPGGRGRFDLNGRKKWVATGLRGAGKTDLGDGICRELAGLMVSWK